jgi:ferredoxin
MDFLEKLIFQGSPYIFSIVTCVGIPAKTLLTVRKALRKKGVELDAGYVIKARCSSLMKMNALDRIIISLDKQRKRLKTGKERLPEILSTVDKKEKHKPETSSWTANIFGTLFHNYGINFFKTAAMSFHVSDKCTGCGSCIRVCPRGNVLLKNGQPIFKDNCELCHACIQWCPEFAITHPDFNNEYSQYRNPEINVKDLLVNA